MDKLLESILTTKRCHNSKGELAFLASLHATVKEHSVTQLAEGCFAVQVGEQGKTLFSCHIDTCHSMLESDGSMQTLMYDEALGQVFVAKPSGCLGADDGAGIYIMLSMIFAKKQGTYIFHRGEEKGCVGSRAVLDKNREWLSKFKVCVAFDRPDTYEVIITQGGTTCASAAYGAALTTALNAQGMKYEVSHRGVITDSKIYRGVISECVNLGVGYNNQHTSQEYQDIEHLAALTKAAIAIGWEALPTSRVPYLEPTQPFFKGARWGGNTQSQRFSHGYMGHVDPAFRGVDDDDAAVEADHKAAMAATVKVAAKSSKPKPAKNAKPKPKPVASLEDLDYYELQSLLGDQDLVDLVVNLMFDLDAERGRTKRLQRLLGM